MNNYASSLGIISFFFWVYGFTCVADVYILNFPQMFYWSVLLFFWAVVFMVAMIIDWYRMDLKKPR